MSQIKNIYQRINQVMSEVEAVQKESKKVNGQYTFVSHDAVSKALHMPMVKAGIVMVPDIISCTHDGNRTSVQMALKFVNADKPDDMVIINAFGQGIDQQDKGIGKAVSYAVKYGLLKMFCLETGDDVEKDNIDHVPAKVEVKAEVKKLSPDQIAHIVKLLNSDEDAIAKICAFFNVAYLGEIDASNFEKIVSSIENKGKKAKVEPMKRSA